MPNPSAILERSIRRDRAIRAAGNDPGRAAESDIIDFIVKQRLYDSDVAREWLAERSSTEDYHVVKRLVDAIHGLVDHAHASEAAAIFSRLLALEDAEGGATRRKDLLGRRSLLRHEIERLLRRPGLLSSHWDTWGTCAVRLQSLLLREQQLEDFEKWGHSQGSGAARRAQDEYFFHHAFYRSERRHRDPWALVATAIENGLAEAVSLSEGHTFRFLADILVASEWELAISQPLVALYDHLRGAASDAWQREEGIRLLCLDEVERPYYALEWRRLLRAQLLPNATNDKRQALLATIRRARSERLVRFNELIQFDAYGLLTRDEERELDEARKGGDICQPEDPRERLTVSRSAEPVGESPKDELVGAWPHAEDHAHLKLLAHAADIPRTAPLSEMEAALFPRLEALKRIVTRAEIDSPRWFGEILGWCGSAIRDLKGWCQLKCDVATFDQLHVDHYLAALQDKTPWWEQRVRVTLEHLAGRPPQDHASHDSDEIYWSSDDPIASSLSYLDEVLAAPIGSQLDVYRDDLAQKISEAWDSWPSFTHGLVIAILRPYHWAKNQSLIQLLVRTLQTETRSRQIEFSLQHLLSVGQPGVTSLMRSLIDRIDTLTSPSDIAHLIGQVIGNAMVRCRGGGDDAPELVEICRWFDELRTDRSQAVSARYSLLAGILWGGESCLGSLDRLTNTHAETWLSMVSWGLSEWLDSEDTDKNDLPILPITVARELRWDQEQRGFLIHGMAEIFLRIISEAELGAFYEVHYELRKLLEEAQTTADHSMGIVDDDTLFSFCRASAERVGRWRSEGRTTNDIAYIFSLSGQSTAELITLVFECAIDRENVRRQLAPIIDILADGGLQETASQLRTSLRRG